MRILHVVHGFPPAAIGGTEQYTLSLCRVLARDPRDEVFVLAREGDPSRPELDVRRARVGGLPVAFVNNTYRSCHSFEDSYRSPAIAALGAGIVDEIRPDVVHVQHLTGLSTGLLHEIAARQIPMVFTLHDYWLICHRGQLFDLDLERCEGPIPEPCRRCVGPEGDKGAASNLVATLSARAIPGLPALAQLGRRVLAAQRRDHAPEVARRALHMQEACGFPDRFVALSRTLRDRFIAFGIAPERIALSTPGTDLARFHPRERVPGGPLRIGFLGSLVASKAPHLLLEAFAQLPRGAATLHVHGAIGAYHGDDGYRAVLAPLLAREGVCFAGPAPHDQVPALLGELDVLVVPSVWLENAPLVIREAFASGVPVVASDLGGMAEAVRHGVDGLLFEPGNVVALTGALLRLCDEPGLLPRLRAGIVPPRSLDADAAETRARYEALLGAQVRRTRPRLAAVVLDYQTPADTLVAVRALEASRRLIDDILVVDGGSADACARLLAEHAPRVTVISTGTNLGYSGGNNVGIRRALERGAELVLLVNPDAYLPPDCVGALEGALGAHPQIGIAGPMLVGRSRLDEVESLGIAYSPRTGRMRHLGAGSAVPAAPPALGFVDGVSGCVLLVRRAVLDHIGLLDEDFFFSFEDLELCLRAREAGFRTVCAGAARAYHEGSASIGARSPARIYYGVRNHLLLARRRSAERGPAAWARAASIVGLGLAHVLSRADAPVVAGLAALAAGVRDHLRERYGQRGGDD